jgi:ferric-chelate reductase
MWCTDLFLRLIRILAYSYRQLFKPSSITKYSASVEVIALGFIRLTVPRPNLFHWRPGQTVSIMLPTVALGQVHPFTIASVNRPRLSSTSITSPVDEKASTSDEAVDYERNLVFLIKVRDGFTKTLFNKVESTPAKERSFPVLLDGPYSSPPLLLGYETVLLIAGLLCSILQLNCVLLLTNLKVAVAFLSRFLCSWTSFSE